MIENAWQLIHTDLGPLVRMGISLAPVLILVVGIVGAKLIRRWLLSR